MQTYFTHLNYSLGDEDSLIEYRLLEDSVNHVISIAGSGARILPLLARQPKKLTCVDISQEQLALTQLRVIAAKHFEYDDFIGFLGYPPSTFSHKKREELFNTLPLDVELKGQLNRLFSRHQWAPIIYLGNFESTLIKFSRFIRRVTRGKLDILFTFNTLQEQNYFVNSADFPNKLWRLIVLLLGNANVLNALLYKGSFPKKNIPGSAYLHYQRIFKQLFQQVLAKKSFFLQLLLLGELRFEAGNPIETEQHVFDKVKEALNITEINYVLGDIIHTIKEQENPVDFVSLSDVPSFFETHREKVFLQDIKAKLLPESKVVSRGHLRLAPADTTGFIDIANEYQTLFAEDVTQLWHIQVYRRAC
ncbi:DUF3419 family protein [Zooshikella harenae]|uniref:DUF3419 family protein n=1 Tax=Zooshikella harenae TaxID=2827238 RepID=A0ABS5ZBK5_9GAMM|nr:DUF3419 family protein [Zooshikella harenae]MBU2711442.1 DUF3419 family protein [Zooshikella harenae]